MQLQSGRSRAAVAAVAVAVVALGAVLSWSGGDDPDPTAAARDSTTTGAPTDDEGSVPTASSAPTPDAGTPEGPSIALEPVAELDQPSAVADPPGAGPVLVSTLDGRIHAVDLDTGTVEPVLDLTSLVSTGGERGLLGMAIDPAGDRLYADFTDVDGNTEIRSWPLADGRPDGEADDGVVHLEIDQPFPNHNGGNLVFGPDGLLWIGTGDGGSAGDPNEVAQDPASLFGKMLRVEPDPAGGIRSPASNPGWGGRPEVWAIGLRNPWRYSFDRDTGLLWVADVGQDTTEEVSVVSAAEARPNFGWDDVEGDRAFEGERDPAFIDPVLVYRHSEGCSITGGHVYRGSSVPSLEGWYLFGDVCGGWIRAVPAGTPGAEPTELIADAGPALSFAELEDGELLFLSPTGISRIVAA